MNARNKRNEKTQVDLLSFVVEQGSPCFPVRTNSAY
jgi:hypothetical protein